MRASSRFLTGVSFVLIVLTLAIAQAQKPEIKIGSSIEDMKDERWQTELDEFQQRAHELGGAVVTRFANGDDDLQFRQINELLKEGIDVLVFLPHDTSKAGRIVEAAHAKHVPVISYDRLASAPGTRAGAEPGGSRAQRQLPVAGRLPARRQLGKSFAPAR